jgi:hypothetical protein
MAIFPASHTNKSMFLTAIFHSQIKGNRLINRWYNLTFRLFGSLRSNSSPAIDLLSTWFEQSAIARHRHNTSHTQLRRLPDNLIKAVSLGQCRHQSYCHRKLPVRGNLLCY